MSGIGLVFLRRGGQAHPTAGSDYIITAERSDPEVFRILMANGVSSDGVGITKEDAAKVTTIGTWFANSSIVSFDELQYFTGLQSIEGGTQKGGAFYNCTSLTSIVLPPTPIQVEAYAFYQCSALTDVAGWESITKLGIAAFSTCPLTNVIDVRMPLLTGTLAQYTFSSVKSPMRLLDLGSITATSGTAYSTQILSAYVDTIRLPATLSSLSNFAFRNATGLRVVICDALTPPTLGSNPFMAVTANFYVPDEVVDTYKTGGWSSYADRIFPLSSYTE